MVQEGDNKVSRKSYSSKYSTVNYVKPTSFPHQYFNKLTEEGLPKYCNKCLCKRKSQTCDFPRRAHRSSCQSSFLLPIMKCIQNYCRPRRTHSHDYNKPIQMNHQEVMETLKLIKLDLDKVTELQIDRCNQDEIAIMDSEGPDKIIKGISIKLNEVLEKMDQKDVPICLEVMTRRRNILNVVKFIQLALEKQMQCELEIMKERQNKLCSLMKGMTYIDEELRCMTKGIKAQCCPRGEGKIGKALESSEILQFEEKSPSSLEKATSVLSLVKDTTEQKVMCKNTADSYEVTGIDLVYSKCTVKTLEGINPTNNQLERTEEENVNGRVECTIPLDGEQLCEIKVQGGTDEPVKLCDETALKDKLCQMSNLWVESARQLINAFQTCQ